MIIWRVGFVHSGSVSASALSFHSLLAAVGEAGTEVAAKTDERSADDVEAKHRLHEVIRRWRSYTRIFPEVRATDLCLQTNTGFVEGLFGLVCFWRGLRCCSDHKRFTDHESVARGVDSVEPTRGRVGVVVHSQTAKHA